MFPFAAHRTGLSVAFFFLVLFCSPIAGAGNISFALSVSGNALILCNQGDSTAYYPSVLRLLADGRWEPLAFPSGVASPAELLPAAKIELAWPNAVLEQSQSRLEKLRPLMVRFYDQAGSGFGQISFLNPPPVISKPLIAGYIDGLMTIVPPSAGDMQATWLLWPQEDGIGPLRHRLDFDVKQPPAQRIAWRAGIGKMAFDLGAGQPVAMLLHETGQGLLLQNVAGGGLQGHQQRAAWLDAGYLFYATALALALLAFIALLARPVAAWRNRSAK